MTNLLLHSKTNDQIVKYLASPSHALIITGAEGSGKLSVARYIAVKLLSADNETDLEKYNYMLLEPDKNIISINDIRAANQFMKLSTIGNRPIRRILIVAQAEVMTTEAQNAFLKLLEEPPDDTVIILTTNNIRSLLPTIVSRAQQLKLNSPDKNSLFDYFNEHGYADDQILRSYYLGDGKIGKMKALLENRESQSFLSSIELAKKLFSQSKYNRLLEISAFTKDKERTSEILDALIIVSQAGLNGSIEKDKNSQIVQWHKALKAVDQAKNSLNANPNLNLLLTDLMLNI